ncbi:MIP18 family protein [Trypanosoma conorhini]|uniref:MIP18 family protein n=1 Tax=Trypanosoma conorhini TaxID=83891 RepID=A0A422NN37_9TRYP|nr:MIP18 family protein [Trypanosoma conorhini]RNF06893.1 MIP18 family protein [Trypanosoma conorhini]
MTELVNPNPTVFRGSLHHPPRRSAEELLQERDDALRDPIDSLEVFHHIRNIRDPEHPNTLEELKVVEPELIDVDEARQTVRVQFTPTVPHCSMTTLIGLCIRLKLQRSLPRGTKLDVCVAPGSHEQEEQVNKQLKDKERVAAALENKNLLSVVESCLNEFE